MDGLYGVDDDTDCGFATDANMVVGSGAERYRSGSVRGYQGNAQERQGMTIDWIIAATVVYMAAIQFLTSILLVVFCMRVERLLERIGDNTNAINGNTRKVRDERHGN